jgi:hypothetical protein
MPDVVHALAEIDGRPQTLSRNRPLTLLDKCDHIPSTPLAEGAVRRHPEGGAGCGVSARPACTRTPGGPRGSALRVLRPVREELAERPRPRMDEARKRGPGSADEGPRNAADGAPRGERAAQTSFASLTARARRASRDQACADRASKVASAVTMVRLSALHSLDPIGGQEMPRHRGAGSKRRPALKQQGRRRLAYSDQGTNER